MNADNPEPHMSFETLALSARISSDLPVFSAFICVYLRTIASCPHHSQFTQSANQLRLGGHRVADLGDGLEFRDAAAALARHDFDQHRVDRCHRPLHTRAV